MVLRFLPIFLFCFCFCGIAVFRTSPMSPSVTTVIAFVLMCSKNQFTSPHVKLRTEQKCDHTGNKLKHKTDTFCSRVGWTKRVVYICSDGENVCLKIAVIFPGPIDALSGCLVFTAAKKEHRTKHTIHMNSGLLLMIHYLTERTMTSL